MSSGRPAAVANLDAMAPNIATNTEVGLDELLEFVRPRHRMLLITERADGSPQASPVSGGVDDGGRIVVATYPQRAKTKNARHRPAVSVVVLSDEWDDAWVQVDGTCEVLDASEGEEALDAFVAYFRSIAGDILDGAAEAWIEGGEDRKILLTKGDTIALEPNVPHSFRTVGDETLRLLGTHVSPKRIVDYTAGGKTAARGSRVFAD